VGDTEATAQVDRRQVDVLDALPRVETGREDRVVVGRGDAGVVEEDVDAPEDLVGLVVHRHDALLVGDVHLDEEAVDLVGDLGAVHVIEVGDDDARALGGERRAVARPMPLAAPVMTATLLSRRPIIPPLR
jgi:hypothetical protein